MEADLAGFFNEFGQEDAFVLSDYRPFDLAAFGPGGGDERRRFIDKELVGKFSLLPVFGLQLDVYYFQVEFVLEEAVGIIAVLVEAERQPIFRLQALWGTIPSFNI